MGLIKSTAHFFGNTIKSKYNWYLFFELENSVSCFSLGSIAKVDSNSKFRNKYSAIFFTRFMSTNP